MSKGSKRRPCCIPPELETIRWDRAVNPDATPESARANLKAFLAAHPEERRWLTGAELELLDGNV
jgi:hypothetical protein